MLNATDLQTTIETETDPQEHGVSPDATTTRDPYINAFDRAALSVDATDIGTRDGKSAGRIAVRGKLSKASERLARALVIRNSRLAQ